MKKILTVLLVAAMMIATPAGIFADEKPAKTDNDQELESNPTAGTVKLVATAASSYTLMFPKQVDVSTSGATANIFAKGDVDGNKVIVIAEKDKGTHVLKDGANLKADVGVSVAFGSGIAGSLIKSDYDNAAKETMTVTHTGLLAGSWSCDLPIVISVQDKAAE